MLAKLYMLVLVAKLACGLGACVWLVWSAAGWSSGPTLRLAGGVCMVALLFALLFTQSLVVLAEHVTVPVAP